MTFKVAIGGAAYRITLTDRDPASHSLGRSHSMAGCDEEWLYGYMIYTVHRDGEIKNRGEYVTV